MKKGFTLLELIIVIIIVGILATIGFTQYQKTVEKGRAAEARSVLGTLRTAQQAYYLENYAYTSTEADLAVDVPYGATCEGTHWFRYTCDNAGECTATRCTSGGKDPNFDTAYSISLSANGTWTNTSGY